MKNNLFNFAGPNSPGSTSVWQEFALTALIAFALAACGEKPEDTVKPTVTYVIVSPTTATVATGSAQTFTAAVEGTNDPAQTVTWSITTSGIHADTKIDNAGKLTVAAAETQTSLTIKATSTLDTSKSDTAVVTVFTPDAAITGVMVSPVTATVTKGDSKYFTAAVEGTNDPDQAVIWSIETAGIAAKTIIDTNGQLAIDAAETKTEITIKATSTANPSKSGTAVVMISSEPVPTVTAVTITTEITKMEKDTEQTFHAEITGDCLDSDDHLAMTWSIETIGVAAETSIASSHPTLCTLTVDRYESLTELTLKAASILDPTKSDTITVTLKPAAFAWLSPPVDEYGSDVAFISVAYGNGTWLGIEGSDIFVAPDEEF